MESPNTPETTPREYSRNPKKSRSRAGALVVGTAALALGGGYFLGANGGSNLRRAEAQAVPAPVTAPVVQTAATRDARAIQDAFAQVSNAVEPAVVTITTSSTMPVASSRPMPNPFGGGNPFGAPDAPDQNNNNDDGSDPFEQFFKQFNQRYDFKPNSAQKSAMRRNFFQKVQQSRRGGGLGSGMIFRADGYILTNAHVVKGADKGGISVKLADDREFKHVKLIGVDENTDIAVLKVDANNLPTVKLGESGDVRVGDWAIAIGNPYGLDHTMTVGVISAKARDVALSARNSEYLQTDASINPGNSGGPLCDISGRVIGINNAIYSQSGGNVGIGFAIPIDLAREIADELVKSGKITRGYLGVEITTLDDAQAAQFGLPAKTKGVLVRNVNPNTPGARAGLQNSDVITAFNGKNVTKSSELQGLVGSAPIGSNATLQVLRNGQTINLTAKLEELPNDPTKKAAPTAPNGDNSDSSPITPNSLGMGLRPLSPELTRRFNLKDARGVLVTNVAANTPAANAGIKRGDVIERVGQRVVTTPDALKNAVKDILGRQPNDDSKSVALLVNRGGVRNFVTVEVDK